MLIDEQMPQFLTYEARTQAVDEDARRGFLRYWRLVSPGAGLVMRAQLAVVAEHAMDLREPSTSVKLGCAPGSGPARRQISRVPARQAGRSIFAISSATQAPWRRPAVLVDRRFPGALSA